MLPLTKPHLRQTAEARLKLLDAAAAATASAAVCARLAALPAVRQAEHLACYAAFGVEIDLLTLARAGQARGQHLYYPRFDAARKQYAMVAVADLERELVPGHWGLLEPAAHLPAVADDLRRRLVWLVPGLAFDRLGHRLGRGAGYYDRLLAGTTGPRLGVAHQCQLVDVVPSAPHDMDMDLIVTDRETVTCRPAPPVA
jgi:5-formyltetrahydrofolate cyclo-ligase